MSYCILKYKRKRISYAFSFDFFIRFLNIFFLKINIVNDWIDGTPPAVYIFNEHLEIISTGGLAGGLTKQDFFSGISKPVNEVLARIFIQLGLIEQTGHGVPLIVNKYNKDVFEFLDNFVKVRIPFTYNIEEERQNQQKSVGVNVGVNVGVKLNKTQQQTYNVISKNPNITYASISKEISKSEETVRRNIKFLVDNKLIERVGSDKTGYWKIIK